MTDRRYRSCIARSEALLRESGYSVARMLRSPKSPYNLCAWRDGDVVLVQVENTHYCRPFEHTAPVRCERWVWSARARKPTTFVEKE